MKNLLILILTLRFSFSLYAQEVPSKGVYINAYKSPKFAEAPRKVFIKNFKVFYQMIAEAEKTVYGGRQIGGASYTGNATARLAVGVEGVDTEHLQSITDKLYQDYKKGLIDMGFEVLTSSDIPDIEFFDGWKKIEGPWINQEQIKGSLMVVPADFSYYVKGVSKKGKEKTGGFMAGVTGDAGGFSTSSMYGPVPNISKELDDMIVVEVNLNVPSIYLDPKSRLGTAKVKGGAYLRLQQAKVAYISGKLGKPGVASPITGLEVTLQKPMVINGVFKSEEFKSVAQKAVTQTPSYAGFFTVENTSVSLSNTIECDPMVYQEEVGKTLKAYLDFTLAKLKVGIAGEKIK